MGKWEGWPLRQPHRSPEGDLFQEMFQIQINNQAKLLPGFSLRTVGCHVPTVRREKLCNILIR